VHPLALAGAVRSGDLAEQLGADAVSEVHAVEAIGMTQTTLVFEYSKFLPSMT
jgi:hypothetical protein